MKKALSIQRVAVLGAGVMGAQIAAHCVNAGIETLLYDLASDESNHNAIAVGAIKKLSKLKPSPIGTQNALKFLQAKNYEDDLEALKGCDLIIEAIAEKKDWKEALYQKIQPFIAEHALFVTNTSGLSVNELAKVLPEKMQERFFGVHFFNPPRYMYLVELIPHDTTDKKYLDELEGWLTSYLGKGVVRAKDTPNFIANRIGVFSLLSTMVNAEKYHVSIEEVDALTGVLIGRPKSATFRTMDVVGLDTMAHVVETMKQKLSTDPWYAYYQLPSWIDSLIADGALGQKAGNGIFKKEGRSITVYDPDSKKYRPMKVSMSSEIIEILAIEDPKIKAKKLFESSDNQAQFLAACFLDLYHYSAYHLEEIADSVRQVDKAMRWGFGWQQGPFESWQYSGFLEVKDQIEQRIEEKRLMTVSSLPHWLESCQEFYIEEKAYEPAEKKYSLDDDLPVYERQRLDKNIRCSKATLFETEAVRLCYVQDDIIAVSFKTKANAINQSVLEGLNEALTVAEQGQKGLIIFQDNPQNFSAGADLKAVASMFKANQFDAIEAMISDFQALVQRFRYSKLPIVAAVRGRALGGGCELMMHTSRIVSGFEAYPGLVEVGVGVIPAGGGCKELARRAAARSPFTDIMTHLRPYFEQVAQGSVATSAPDALNKGFLQPNDSWVMNANEVLFAACSEIEVLAHKNYLPPIKAPFQVAGREGHAKLQAGLVNWLEGGFISEHDYLLGNQLAKVLCGGEVDEGTFVNDEWMLQLEKEAFMQLIATEKTQERILHLLSTGKILRN